MNIWRKWLVISFVCGAALSVNFGSRAQELQQVHLKGITGVNVALYVDRRIDGFNELEDKLNTRVSTALSQGGLSSQSRQGLTLSIDATTYPTGNLARADVSLLTIRVRLSEPVQLRRDSSLQLPGGNGAITWSNEWTLLVRKSDAADAIERQTQLQIDSFVAAVNAANK